MAWRRPRPRREPPAARIPIGHGLVIAETPLAEPFPQTSNPDRCLLSKPVSPDKTLRTVNKLLRPAQALMRAAGGGSCRNSPSVLVIDDDPDFL